MSVVELVTPEFSPPITPASASAPLESAMTDRLRARVVATVEREKARSHSHDERRCRRKSRRVEGMQRLAQFHHYVVSDVHDVVDGAQPMASIRRTSHSGLTDFHAADATDE